MEAILEFLSSNKEVFGAVAAILESFAVIWNLWRKWKKNKGSAGVMSAPPSFLRSTLWVFNPINIFRQPK